MHQHLTWIYFLGRCIFLMHLKIQISPTVEASTITFRPIGLGLFGTYYLKLQRPVKEIICSSIESLVSTCCCRHPCHTLSTSDLTSLHHQVLSRSFSTFIELLSLKYLSRDIALCMTGTLVSFHAVYIEISKNSFISPGVFSETVQKCGLHVGWSIL